MPASLLLVSLAGAVLSACATTSAVPLPVRVLVVPSRDLVVKNVKVERDENATVVRGSVGRRGLARDNVGGRLNVEALAEGRVIVWADTRWSELAAKHRLPTSHFRAELPSPPTPIDEIRVSHAFDEHGDARRSGTPQ